MGKKRMEEGENTKNKIQKTFEKEKKSNEARQDINRNINNNDGEQAYKTKTMNVCGRYVNHTCWRGRDCTLEHPAMCEADVYHLFCRDKLCKLYHPQVCFTNLHHKVCKWGAKCKSRHLENDVQGYEHKYIRRRHDNHYSHHRHGDGLYDRSYDRSDDRHQNKREAHDPYRLKNRDIGNKNVYNAYKGYRNHSNSHQNPQMGPPNEKYNQGTQGHQGPIINYPKDKYGHDTHFLGHQQNQTDWPTPMEAKLLRTLRLNGWGPVRG